VISQLVSLMSPRPGTWPFPVESASMMNKNLNIKCSLHVNIYDTAHHQFTVPTSIVTPPGLSSSFGQISSDLEFHYEPSPFAFWITRRGASKGSLPLFDTRPASLPRTPIPPIDPQEKRTALDGFSLVFEDVYLQARTNFTRDSFLLIIVQPHCSLHLSSLTTQTYTVSVRL
jgi:hypothetical protein